MRARVLKIELGARGRPAPWRSWNVTRSDLVRLREALYGYVWKNAGVAEY